MKLIVVFFLLASSMAAILGIDYGHQFTKAIILAPTVNFEILLTEEARRKDLSGISIRKGKLKDDLERVYGTAAQSLCTRFPQSCITGIKPLIGKSFQDREVADYLTSHFGLKVIPDDVDRPNAIKFDLGLTNQSYQFTVEEILAMTLKTLRHRALDTLDENPVAKSIVDDVSLAVPPFFTQQQRQAYLDALDIAGFKNVLALVDEGTAVAVNFISSKKFEQKDYDDKKRYYMIYDLGAGSTKATLFSVTPFSNLTTVVEFENIGYDETFGGQLLTQSIYTILVEKLASSLNFDENNELPPRTAARLWETAEKAKIILSANADFHVNLEGILDDHDFKAAVTRDEFEAINIDNMARVTQPIMSALHHTDVSINDLKAVVLTGGSSRVPFIQKHLSTLLGDDKISKTVNADESCAVGTTVMGFRLKTQFGSHKDFEIIDKSFHDYEISVNNNDFNVFPKGTISDSNKKIDLGGLVDDLSVQLYEDGSLIKTYNIEKILDKTASLTCNNDPKYKKHLFGHFVIDSNKMFNFKKLEAECVKTEKDSFFQKLLKKDGEEEVEADEADEADEAEDVEQAAKEGSTDSSTNENSSASSSNSTGTAKPRKKVLRPIPIGLPRPQFSSMKHMSKPLKQRISDKLNFLDSKDDLKDEIDGIKNTLEAACYSLRNLVEENEDAIAQELSVDDIRTEIGDTIEWLEFESDDSPVSEFEAKVEQVKLKQKEVDSIIKMSTTDLTLPGMKKLYDDGTSILMKLQSRLLELGGDINAIRQKYESNGFDFNKENERIKAQLVARGEDKMLTLDKELAKYKDLLTDLGGLVELDEKKFSKIAKRDLFDKFEAITDSIVTMLADILMVDQSHKERLELFNSKLDKLIERKQQKEFREKLKQEKAEEKAKAKENEGEDTKEDERGDAEQEESAKDQDQIEDQDSQTKQEESEGDHKDSENIDHDEL